MRRLRSPGWCSWVNYRMTRFAIRSRVHLDALYKITQAGSQMLAHQIQASRRPIDWRNQPLGEDERRRAVVAGCAGETVRELRWRSALVGTNVGLARR